jgi:hypothetical protein
MSIGHSYLLSRQNQQADTNLESEEGPAKFSTLQRMLSTDLGSTASGSVDDIVAAGRDQQDNPPYEVLDLSDSGDVQHDITEEVELSRIVMMPQGSGATVPMTTVFDVPFGLFRVLAANRDPGDNSGIVDDLALCLEVLDIYEMQG